MVLIIFLEECKPFWVAEFRTWDFGFDLQSTAFLRLNISGRLKGNFYIFDAEFQNYYVALHVIQNNFWQHFESKAPFFLGRYLICPVFLGQNVWIHVPLFVSRPLEHACFRFYNELANRVLQSFSSMSSWLRRQILTLLLKLIGIYNFDGPVRSSLSKFTRPNFPTSFNF